MPREGAVNYPRLLGRSRSEAAAGARKDPEKELKAVTPPTSASPPLPRCGTAPARRTSCGRGSLGWTAAPQTRVPAAPATPSAAAGRAARRAAGGGDDVALRGADDLGGLAVGVTGRRRSAAFQLFQEVEIPGCCFHGPATPKRSGPPTSKPAHASPWPADALASAREQQQQQQQRQHTASASTSCQEPSARRLIAVQLQQSKGAQWGFRASQGADGGRSLVVTHIDDSGLLVDWNARCSESERILVGDRVEQVNGRQTVPTLFFARSPSSGAATVIFSRAEGGDKEPDDSEFGAGPRAPAALAAESGEPARYGDGSVLEQLVRSGDVALVRASWLSTRSRDAGSHPRPLPRRQELPREAVWGADELVRALRQSRGPPKMSGDGGSLPVVAVSYFWLARAHPDPQGAWAQLLGLLAATCLDHYRRLLGDKDFDLAIFIDWCSTYQEPRTDEERASLKRATQGAAALFVHPQTEKWLMTKGPRGCESASYADRGWSSFERAVASLATSQESILDLGQVPYVLAWGCPPRKDGRPTTAVYDAATNRRVSWADISRVCQRGRPPPARPQCFSKELAGKTWSKQADLAWAQQTYERMYRTVVEGAKELHLTQCRWRAKDIATLSRALSGCQRLRVLNLQHNLIDDSGAITLARALSDCQELACLVLSHNCIDDAGAKGLASALSHCSRLSHLLLAQNNMGDAGAASLAEAMPGCPPLVHLDVSSNCIGDDAKERLAAAWEEVGKPAERRPGLLCSAEGLFT